MVESRLSHIVDDVPYWSVDLWIALPWPRDLDMWLQLPEAIRSRGYINPWNIKIHTNQFQDAIRPCVPANGDGYVQVELRAGDDDSDKRGTRPCLDVYYRGVRRALIPNDTMEYEYLRNNLGHPELIPMLFVKAYDDSVMAKLNIFGLPKPS